MGVVDNTFCIILYKTLGLLTPGTLKSVLLLIPFALLGLFMGIKCCGHMNEKSVRKITIVLLILSVIFKGEPYIIEGYFSPTRPNGKRSLGAVNVGKTED